MTRLNDYELYTVSSTSRILFFQVSRSLRKFLRSQFHVNPCESTSKLIALNLHLNPENKCSFVLVDFSPGCFFSFVFFSVHPSHPIQKNTWGTWKCMSNGWERCEMYEWPSSQHKAHLASPPRKESLRTTGLLLALCLSTRSTYRYGSMTIHPVI